MEKWGILDELVERGTKLTGCKFIDREWSGLYQINSFCAQSSSERGFVVETGESLGYLQWSDKVCRELGGPAYSIFVRPFLSFKN